MQKAMAPHSSTLAWKIPWTEELGRLQSMGSLNRTGLRDFTFTFHFHTLEKEMATHSSVPAWRIPGTMEPNGLPSMGLYILVHKFHQNIVPKRLSNCVHVYFFLDKIMCALLNDAFFRCFLSVTGGEEERGLFFYISLTFFDISDLETSEI